MHLNHEAVLANIERRVCTPGATLDEVDAAIAAELDVPTDTYYAYLLVWAAIEAYRQQRSLADPGWPGGGAAPTEGVQRCQAAAATIGWYAANSYQQATDLGPLATGIADHASKTLGAVLQLGQHLRDLHAALPDPTQDDGGEAMRS